MVKLVFSSRTLPRAETDSPSILTSRAPAAAASPAADSAARA
jgi:hypothetical protein